MTPRESPDSIGAEHALARKDGDRERLYSRQGNDLTYRFPLIVEACGRCHLSLQERDRDGRSHLLCCRHSGPSCEDDIHLEADELGCDLAIALVASLRPAIFDSDGAALDPAKFTQPLHEGCGPRIPVQRRARAQNADGRPLRLLRASGQWPRRRTAEQCHELAPSHHSITSSARASRFASSARASRFGGISKPSMRAVWALMTSSNLADCSTGRSAGLAPLRMRPA